jgi:uncharacterized membrane protein (DUF485 family)
MMTSGKMNWAAIDADPRFQRLHKKKTVFLWSLMLLSMAYYFLLPVGAAYHQELFRTPVWGPVNLGLVFALSQFLVAWAIALVYARRANREFDAMAEDINRHAHTIQ